jgi:hypothetical protein
MIQEARLYSYKTDKLTGDVLPDIIDRHNHGWDAARYGLLPLIRHRVPVRRGSVCDPSHWILREALGLSQFPRNWPR